MLRRYRVPKTIIWVVNLLLIFLLIFTLFRFSTYLAFCPGNFSFSDVLPSFLMGIQYDLRWIAIVLLPIVVISMSPRLSPFYSLHNRKWWSWYLVVVTFFVFFLFAADFGSFSYNRTRLDAGAMNFVEDPGISLKMMWQTYPLFWMVAGLVVAVLLFRWMYHKSHWRVVAQTQGLKIPYRRKYFIITAGLLCLFIYGRLGTSPLSWHHSFVFQDNFKSYLALNPLQNFFTTLKFRRPEFNEQKAREVFAIMKEKLQLPPENEFSYRRVIVPGSTALESRPNIVLVLCESFSMYKSTMSGNPLNTTPFFDSLSRNGIFFEKCFTPHFSTARGLFATITGIPDAQLFKFSTRNPLAVKQRTIINDFEEYDKHYFLGGDPDFNNFRGLLQNIKGLQMHTGDSLKYPKINVWGISDKDLFREANHVFKKASRPFFAIVQTSENHRPYMIAETDTDFKRKIIPEDSLLKYGFESLDEYNTFRHADDGIRQFMEAAASEHYFHNTIFVFVGDHGVAGNAEAIYPDAWTTHRLTDEHVPLLFYAPYLLKPDWRKEVVSQIDVLPTIAGMVQQPYVNTTLGRDLLFPGKKESFAFITNTAGKIGIVTDDFYFIKNINPDFADEQLIPLHNKAMMQSVAAKDSAKNQLSIFSTAFFETARYMLMNNRE